MMNGIIGKCVILVFLAILVTACFNHHKIQRVYTFSADKFELTSSHRNLDTLAIYYNVLGNVSHGDSLDDSLIEVFKFYSNGRVLLTSYYDKIPSTDSITFSTADELDYYKIEEGKLKIEVLRDPMSGFSYCEGDIYKDSLVFSKYNNQKVRTVYLKSTR